MKDRKEKQPNVGKGRERQKYRRENPGTQYYPRNDPQYIEKVHYLDANLEKGESERRNRWIKKLAVLKLLLEHGCGRQGHLKCRFPMCNMVLNTFINKCPADEVATFDYKNDTIWLTKHKYQKVDD